MVSCIDSAIIKYTVTKYVFYVTMIFFEEHAEESYLKNIYNYMGLIYETVSKIVCKVVSRKVLNHPVR